MHMKYGISYGLLFALLIIANPMSADQNEGLFERAKAQFFASKTVNNVRDRYNEWQQKRKEKMQSGLKSDVSPTVDEAREQQVKHEEEKKEELKDALQNRQSTDEHHEESIQNDQSNAVEPEKKESKLGRNVTRGLAVVAILFVIGWMQKK